MKYQLKVIKSGSNKGHKWVYGILSNGTVSLKNIFNIQSDQDILDGAVLVVKQILVTQDHGKFYFDLGL